MSQRRLRQFTHDAGRPRGRMGCQARTRWLAQLEAAGTL